MSLNPVTVTTGRRRSSLATALMLAVGATSGAETTSTTPVSKARWTSDAAKEWYAKTGWLVGCNFSPSTAINQLEMWQAETFDPTTIDRELGLAAGLGFNSIRVYLHDIPWKQDQKAYLQRLEQFLDIAAKHKIGVMFVIFDSVWDPNPKAGKQREPEAGLHNPGWVQSPGLEILRDLSRHDELEGYVKGLIGHFKNDSRVHVWDLFNEPDNANDPAYIALEPADKEQIAVALLEKTFQWATEVDPIQPLTSAVWRNSWRDPKTRNAMEKLQLEKSDVISFHNYADIEDVKESVELLKAYNRPIICTEYMARPHKSTFDPVLGYFKEQNISAYNWGFVSGKTQTIYPWDSWKKRYTEEPPLWFHDIFRADGTPYKPEEVEYIRRVTGKARPAAEK